MWLAGSSEGLLLPKGQGVGSKRNNLASRAGPSQEWGSPSPGHWAPPWGWDRHSWRPALLQCCWGWDHQCWLMALWGWDVVLGYGQDGGGPGGLGSGNEAWWCPQGWDIWILLWLQSILRLERAGYRKKCTRKKSKWTLVKSGSVTSSVPRLKSSESPASLLHLYSSICWK